MQLTPEVEKLINQAIQYAVEHHHEFVSLEHVLWGMTQDKETTDIIEACGGEVGKLRKQLAEFMEQHCPKLDETPVGKTGTTLPSQVDDEPGNSPSLTIAFHRVVQRAILQVQSADRDKVTTSSLLISLLREEESPGVVFLSHQGVTRFDVINYVSHGIGKADDTEAPPPMEDIDDGTRAAPEPDPDSGESSKPEEKSAAKGDPLKSFCVNLNDRAKKGLIDPLIGREDVLERAVQILARRTKNNVLLVGEPGVGKTAIADGLALRIVQGNVPPKLKKAVLYSLDLGSLVAGTKFRGDFENRIKSVVKALEAQPDSILFIDEIHNLVGAGAVSGGSMDAANLLKPSLANRTISCIGSTTYKEFRTYLEKDQGLVRRFQKIDIKPPSVEETVKILEGLQPRYEDFHQVVYTPEAIRAAAELSNRFIQGRPLPDKAIDVMDESGARLRLKAPENEIPTVGEKEIEDVVSRIAQVPARSVSSSDKAQLKNLEEDLKKVIFGQDKAIEKLVASIKLSRAGLGNPQKPIGSFLFTGPTGVGKTEVCKQLARILGNELIRLDMSEYMEKHTVSRLVGAPPGYVGYDEGGILTEAVFKNPYCVILMDEMEKAHPDIANILLQVMDNGKLTDTNGKVADFRNAILIMTSNAGAREVAKPGIGIVQDTKSNRALNAIKNLFQPEFINRLDAVVPFEGLTKPVVMLVIDKFLEDLATQLKEKKVEIKVTEKAKDWLFEHGYDAAYGARPLGRTIDENVKKKLVDQLLFGALEQGGSVLIDAGPEGIFVS